MSDKEWWFAGCLRMLASKYASRSAAESDTPVYGLHVRLVDAGTKGTGKLPH